MQEVDFSRFQKGSKGKFNKLPKDQVLDILSKNLQPVYLKDNDKVLDSSKYVRLARDYKYDNYKLCTYKDIKRLGLEDSFTGYQKQFFAEAGATVAIFNEINGKLISVVFRAITEKAFMDYSLTYSLYGYDMLPDDFKYGDYLILTEGIYDADALRQLYPSTVAMLTSNITVMQSEILKSLTNRFIVAFDADDAGEAGFKTALKRLGTDIKRLKVYQGDKDIGVMEEKKLSNPIEYDLRKKYYLDAITDCKTGLGFSL